MAQLSPYTMQIKELAITELHEYENNPRNNDGAVDAVAASIQEFGFKKGRKNSPECIAIR